MDCWSVALRPKRQHSAGHRPQLFEQAVTSCVPDIRNPVQLQNNNPRSATQSQDEDSSDDQMLLRLPKEGKIDPQPERQEE